jgi:hypothetical protein
LIARWRARYCSRRLGAGQAAKLNNGCASEQRTRQRNCRPGRVDPIPPSLANCARNCHLAAMLTEIIRYWDFHMWTVIAVLAGVTAFTSILADQRRNKRIKLENVGFMPWTGISVMATLVTVVSLALAIKAG